MKIIYIVILILKILENCLSTYRIIVITKGKKLLGAFLQAFITLVWLISTSACIIDIKKDYYKVIFLVLGSFVGSYLGSLIEKKH